VRRAHHSWRTSQSARIDVLAAFLVTAIVSLAIGLWIPQDRGALLVALTVASAIVVVLVIAWQGWLRRRLGPGTPAASSATNLMLDAAPRPYLVPRELPSAPADFVGRSREMARLQAAVDRGRNGRPFTLVTYGPAGIGKSALALTFAHKLAPSFPHGQLFVRMRGAREMTSDEVIKHFVVALKGPTDRLPSGSERLREEYARLTRERSVLFVLDDAPASLDIADISPACPDCLFIVTCRERPAWPEDSCECLALEALEPVEALEMLRTTIGAERVNKEAESSRDLASLCGLRPLALRAAGTAVANRPSWDIGLILKLAQSASALTGKDPADGGDFDAAYALLTTDEREALRVLGVLRASDFAPWMLAAALRTDEARGSRLAARLADAGLIERYSPGSGASSYRAEEPVLEYALQRAAAEEDHTESAPLRELIADAQSQRDESVAGARIATLDELLRIHDGFTPAIGKVRTAVSRAQERNSLAGEAEACAALAELYADLGDMVVGHDLAQRARRLGDAAASESADKAVTLLANHSRARALRCLVRIERRRHSLDRAAVFADMAVKYAEQAHDGPERAHILQEKAVVLALQGAAPQAEELSQEALTACAELGEAGEALLPSANWARGTVLLHLHRYGDAAMAFSAGKDAAGRLGQTRMSAWIDHASACAAFANREWELAAQHATSGLNSFTNLRHRYGAAHCRYRLGQVYNRRRDSESDGDLKAGPRERRADEHHEAVRFLREALETFRNCGDMWIEGEVALELADAYRRRGRVSDAIRLQRLARRIYRQMDGHLQARQAAWALLRTILTSPLPRRFRVVPDAQARVGLV